MNNVPSMNDFLLKRLLYEIKNLKSLYNIITYSENSQNIFIFFLLMNLEFVLSFIMNHQICSEKIIKFKKYVLKLQNHKTCAKNF